jgi:LuxR family transcriptional regulator, maltose regulon positive regulatory protein
LGDRGRSRGEIGGTAMNEVIPLLLTTKTQPPRRAAGLIDRPRLFGLTDRIATKLLTVIKAAAGFGKTCFAAQLAEHLRRDGAVVAWLSLDASDDEPARFLFNIAHVLRRVRDGIGKPAIDLIREISLLPSQTIVATLINDLADSDDEVYLFLDDYQYVTQHAIHDGISFFLRNASSNFHLILITRVEPPFPLARLRVQNQLLEIDGSLLRFDLEETRHFLEQEKLDVPRPAELTELLAKTEGWPAVLRIVTSTCGRDFPRHMRGLTGGSRPIGAYLTEMLEGLPEDMTSFMIRTAILDRLSAPLCQAVTSESASQDLLRSIEIRQLLLIPLDQDGTWYRFHPLLREHLNQRLEALPSDERKELHRRACLWYAGQELWTDAVGHAIAAGNTEQAARWIENVAMALVKRGDLLPLLGWQRSLPVAFMRGQMKVRLAIAWGLALAMRFEEALHRVAEIERDPAAADFPDTDALECECQAIRAVALALKDDTAAARPLAEATLRRQPVDPSTFNGVSDAARFCYWKSGDLPAFHAAPWAPFSEERGRRNVFVTVYWLCLQGLVEFDQLRVTSAERHYLEAMHLVEEVVGANAAAAALPASLLAQVRYEQGRLDEAEALIIDRMPIIDATGMLECVSCAYVVLSRVAAHRGNIDRAYAVLERAETLGHTRQWGRLISVVLLERSRIQVAEGRIAEAAACATRLERLARDHPAPERCAWSAIHDHAAMARAALTTAEGRAPDGLTILKRLHHDAVNSGRSYAALQLAVRLAAAELAAHQPVQAASAFRAALLAAEPASLCQPILDQGPEVAGLLRGFRDSVQRSGDGSGRLRQIDGFAEYCLRRITVERDVIHWDTEADGLSPRERGVLALLSEGRSNKDIARALSIAPETVKSHVKNIFAKLGVERRTQAVSRALSLGLARTA